MRRFALLGLVLATAFLAVTPLGLAGSGSFSDPRGDQDPSSASANFDIVRATYGHSKGRLVHTVTVAGTIANPASADPPELWIEDPEAPNNTSDCRYFVGRFEGRLGVFTCGYAERVGSARIRRTSSTTVRYEFSPKAIGSPDSYRWAFLTRTTAAGGTLALVDRLPSGDHRFHTHALR